MTTLRLVAVAESAAAPLAASAPEFGRDPDAAEDESEASEPDATGALPDPDAAAPELFEVWPALEDAESPPLPFAFESPELPLFEPVLPLLLPLFDPSPLLPGELLPLLLPPVPLLGAVEVGCGVLDVVVGAGACVGVVLVVRALAVVLVLVECVPSMMGVRIGASGFRMGSRMGMSGIGKGRLMRARSSRSPVRRCRCCMVLRAATAACMAGAAALV
ncbi:hypothetical protein C2E23DRAFT_846237 [Lenzites betulinus]|nr:hypothetical protein C2E23DRAFT_846237 [Lenzites betulinus]